MVENLFIFSGVGSIINLDVLLCKLAGENAREEVIPPLL